jgi:hypothetical protein
MLTWDNAVVRGRNTAIQLVAVRERVFIDLMPRARGRPGWGSAGINSGDTGPPKVGLSNQDSLRRLCAFRAGPADTELVRIERFHPDCAG